MDNEYINKKIYLLPQVRVGDDVFQKYKELIKTDNFNYSQTIREAINKKHDDINETQRNYTD